MTDGHGQHKESLKERLYLFGIRPLMLTAAIIAVGIYVTAAGIVYGYPETLVGGVIIILIGFGLGYGFKTTTIRRITKRYYAVDTIVGKEGTAKSSFDADTKGVVNVDNEYWSAVTDGRIQEGEDVLVVAVEQDKVTLRVKKQERA